MASSAAQAAFEPYLTWMVATIAIFEARSASAAAQGASYGTAVAATPTLGELAANHFTHGVLEGTNFLGCNTIPIGVNEFEYLVVLWNRAAEAMDEYSAATGVNTAFDPFTMHRALWRHPGLPRPGWRPSWLRPPPRYLKASAGTLCWLNCKWPLPKVRARASPASGAVGSLVGG